MPFNDWILQSSSDPEETQPLPQEAKAILDQYAHVFPEEIPLGVPSKRTI